LESRGDLGGQRNGRLRDLGEHSVLSQSDSVKLLVGLEVNVGGATLDGVEHHLVDESNDRSVVNVSHRDFAAGFLVRARNLQLLKVEVVLFEGRHGRINGLDGAYDTCLELVLLYDDRLDS